MHLSRRAFKESTWVCGSRNRLENDPTSSQPGKTHLCIRSSGNPSVFTVTIWKAFRELGWNPFYCVTISLWGIFLHPHYFLIVRMCELMSRGPFPAELCSKALLSGVLFFFPLIGTQTMSAWGKWRNCALQSCKSASFSLGSCSVMRGISGWGTGMFFQGLHQPGKR